MNKRLRQSIIGLIWPGPIAGPLPINLFRILAPLLVIYVKPLAASLVMGILTAALSVYYYRLLELSGGREYVENLLKKLPTKAHRGIENKGPLALFASSLVFGVFTYAVFLRLLRYSETKSEIFLIASAFVSSIIWTGIFWGGVVEISKRFITIAF
ncbi:MAG: hypothetical protein A2Z11_00375 [Candidatus Woykebacteria bacterium RBG_16_43_9]|uniref:Uncharacterized protein n=1 Tax=Candidatus Woykebacteria bacterium RBG_16_43_9 TaxID=1802596 RepID=A0A1G1WBT0_9BACT|nr:MAG: hypothetical protein A2Z11_00375 [Candidatus Woykebacteria bacterium RBG_16_43_9]